jgi:isoleucyl-tRNA synthetase
MQLAQHITSLALSIRKKENIRVRQPLQKILIPVVSNNENLIKNVETIILNEINVKEIEFLNENNNVLKKQVKPNFKTLGPKFGKQMKDVATMINSLSEKEIKQLEENNIIKLDNEIAISLSDVTINTKDIPGYSVATNEEVTVALDTNISEDLKNEGLAREFVNRIQNYRKDNSFEVTDKITINVLKDPNVIPSFQKNLNYICDETLTEEINFIENIDDSYVEFNLVNSITTKVKIQKSKNG